MLSVLDVGLNIKNLKCACIYILSEPVKDRKWADSIPSESKHYRSHPTRVKGLIVCERGFDSV